MKEKFFVDAEWVYLALNDGEDMYTVVDIPYGKKEYIDENDPQKRKFEDGHIPRAVKITKEDFEGPETDLNIYNPDKIKELLLSKGINNESRVIVYSDGYNASGRLAFILYWMGVNEVKILEGNFEAWLKKGYPIETGEIIPEPITCKGWDAPKRPEVLISTPEDVVNEQSSNPNFVLASIRGWEEYIGKVSGYPWIDIAGSPLGAVYAKASKLRTDTDYLFDEHNNIVDLTELFKEWEEWGISEDIEVAFFCGSGWRATLPFFICKEQGWENVKLYDGGWYQWLKYHEEQPDIYKIQVGDPRTENGLKIL